MAKERQTAKEGLVLIFTILPPFVTHLHLAQAPFDVAEIRKLQNLLMAEVEACARIDGLALDDLRLEIGCSHANDRPFLLKSFQSSSGFSANQAHIWAVLELQADCLAKVHKQRHAFRPDC